MITVKNIERRLKTIDYTKPNPPQELLESLVKDGRSRILKSAQEDCLCSLSNRYFEFCLSQVGSFCTAPYNAVEIALRIGVQPIYVAAAIYIYGLDWQQKFLGLKRFDRLDRGEYTVWKSSDAWFNLAECKHRVESVTHALSGPQSILRQAVRRGDMIAILKIAETNPHRMMSILPQRRGLLYDDPRMSLAKKKREQEAAASIAKGISTNKPVGRSEYGDIDYQFNGALHKAEMARTSVSGIEWSEKKPLF